jgi:hypothetical protein
VQGGAGTCKDHGVSITSRPRNVGSPFGAGPAVTVDAA